MIDKLALIPQWQIAKEGEIPELQHNEVHLWHLPLELDQQQQERALSFLSDIQHDRYARRRTEHKASYLAGRYYLLTILAAYSRCKPEQVLLSYTRMNKPFLTDTSAELYFNFTDTRFSIDGARRNKGEQTSAGLFAFSRAGELGVDIEALSRRSNFKAIVESRFSKAEQQLVTETDGRINPELFLAIWTRKEASGKATGQGINFKMNERELIQGHQAQLNYVDEKQQPWRLTQLRLNKELIGCVAHAGHQDLPIKAFNCLRK